MHSSASRHTHQVLSVDAVDVKLAMSIVCLRVSAVQMAIHLRRELDVLHALQQRPVVTINPNVSVCAPHRLQQALAKPQHATIGAITLRTHTHNHLPSFICSCFLLRTLFTFVSLRRSSVGLTCLILFFKMSCSRFCILHVTEGTSCADEPQQHINVSPPKNRTLQTGL